MRQRQCRIDARRVLRFRVEEPRGRCVSTDGGMTSAAEGAVLGLWRVALRGLLALSVAGLVACGPGNDERR